jgi:hypothetical protein
MVEAKRIMPSNVVLNIWKKYLKQLYLYFGKDKGV